MQPKFIEFQQISDVRGNLVALEEGKDIPFSFKRIYYIYGVPADIRRGFHAHKALQQVIICLKGNCKILLDDGSSKVNIDLCSPAQGLHVDKMVWREMYEFSEDCVLAVLADDIYDERDYIRDYQSFIEAVS